MPERAGRPSVSVIMNAYNSERYLAEALESVLSQTHTDWELIFWDNQSEDRSVEVASGYGDPRIRVFRAPRKTTLGECRTLAARQARGAWLAFLDCDDLWLPHKLEAQLGRVRDDGGDDVGLVYARTHSFSARGEEGETVYRYTGRDLPEGEILKTLLREGNVIPLVSAMVKASAFWEVGGIPPDYTFAEDYYLFVAIAEKYRVLCVQAPCCRYRVHEESMTARFKTASHRESLKVLRAYAAHLTPAEVRRRERVYHTLIGIDAALTHGKYLEGLREIALDGSIPFLLRGLAANAFRRLVLRRRPVS